MKVHHRFYLFTCALFILSTSGRASFCQSEAEESSNEPAPVSDISLVQTSPSERDRRSQRRNSSEANGGTLLKGQVAYTVPSGTPLKLKLTTVPTYAMKMMERDLEGDLLPARVGQIITAKLSEDLFVDDNKVIPEGTEFHGHVSKIMPPRRVGRPGSLVLSFDQITTPDGRKFAFRAQADNFKPSTLKTKAKGFGIIAAHAAGGAIVGAMVGYQLFGMEKTIAMHGYNVAGGAAGGAILATGFAIMRRGPAATLEPGDDLNMQMDSDLLMPVAVEPKVKKAPNSISGLEIKIEKCKVVGDGLGDHMYTIDTMITNESDHSLSSIDLYLEDTNGNRSPVCSSYDNDSEFLFTLEPGSRRHLHLSFAVRYPKMKQQLVWLEHEDKTVCYRQALH